MKRSLKILSLFSVLTILICSFASCGLIGSITKDILGNESEADFYNTVYENKELIDALADDIYQNWYDSIYNDKFSNDIDKAIDAAFKSHEDNIDTILENDDKINALYKEIKNGYMKDDAKKVMQAYNEYYTLVVEVSGSFNDYSANKETIKKELSTALKNYLSEY